MPESPTKPDRPRLARRLPPTRLSFDTQLEVLRAYGAASGAEHKAVSNAEVAAVVRLNPDSVSLCNPFWIDVQLLTRDGNKQQPMQAVYEYLQAYQWHPESAATRLGAVLSDAWFAKALLPRLTFKSLSKIEAIRLLADEIKAPKEVEANLSLLLDYLRAAGIIALENGTVALPPKSSFTAILMPKDMPSGATQPTDTPAPPPRQADVKTFQLPIPGKPDAVISVPDNLDAEDWAMLSDMLETYVVRWKKFEKRTPASKRDEVLTNKKGEADDA
jgi:hypothetical protein